jgi:hypothetical protein
MAQRAHHQVFAADPGTAGAQRLLPRVLAQCGQRKTRVRGLPFIAGQRGQQRGAQVAGLLRERLPQVRQGDLWLVGRQPVQHLAGGRAERKLAGRGHGARPLRCQRRLISSTGNLPALTIVAGADLDGGPGSATRGITHTSAAAVPVVMSPGRQRELRFTVSQGPRRAAGKPGALGLLRLKQLPCIYGHRAYSYAAGPLLVAARAPRARSG